ncbi:MAG: magnesium transporter [Candidatus Aenigmarchaeota archaeon]|nr:magnesium transporter [Candidatus Aenigmarchaeota archaeon]MDW8149127.1 magnesium transporter [Candidatus Aenigmarchaeota archaeon]
MKKKFPPKTAGSQMITAVPTVKIGVTVNDLRRIILKNTKIFDTIDYIYVVDKNNVLSGVISIKELLSASENIKVEKLMKKNIVYVYPYTPQERVVYLALSNGIKAVPVVDKEKHFLGIVPYDTILRIFNEEVGEDIFRFGGIMFHRDEKGISMITTSTLTMVKSRLPWLILGVIGGIVAASIVSIFENTLATLLALAAFIPSMVYLTDAAGTQSEALIIRAMALNPKISIKTYLIREFKVAFFLALICGLILSLISGIGWKNLLLGSIVGVSMFLGMWAGILISTLLPIFFKKINIDPAAASGPFATLLSDITTLTIYFVVALVFLNYFKLF